MMFFLHRNRHHHPVDGDVVVAAAAAAYALLVHYRLELLMQMGIGEVFRRRLQLGQQQVQKE
jgi:hypothetical protein